MMKSKGMLVLLAVLFSCSLSVHAAFVPAWQGLDGTTYQEWNFTNDDTTAVPDVVDNDYGNASANITVGQWGSGWYNDLGDPFSAVTGIWDIGGIDGSIILGIDNNPAPLPQKEIWVQVTYYEGLTTAPTIDVPGAQFVSSETVLVEEDVISGAAWYLQKSIWQISPNPSSEQIIVTGADMGSVIGQVIVDTYSVPEPASMALLALGGFAVLRKRKQRS